MEHMEKESATYKQMTQAPLKRLICKMAVPGVISMVITAVYNMVDTYFVGQLGTSASGAVGIVFSLMALILAIGLFFGHGSGNYISRELGAQRMENAEAMFSTGFFLCLAVSSALAVIGLIFLEPMVRLLGATETILPYACDYTRYILLGAPFMAGTLTLNNQFRCQGSPILGMIGVAAGAVINIVLDPLFIIKWGMGTGGAGLATMISQMVSFLILLLQGLRGRGDTMRLRLRCFTLRADFIKEIIRTGFPSFARQMLTAASTICLNHAAGVYGDAAIAAMAIVARTMGFVNSAILGFGQGYQPVCGFNYGSHRYDRVLEGFRFCVYTATGILLFTCAGGFIFAERVVGLFRDDPEVIAFGARALRMQCAVFPLVGYVVVSNMLFQNIGYTGKATLLALARQGIFFLPLLYLLTAFLGKLGIQLAQPLADVFTFAMALPMGLKVIRQLREKQKLEDE